jgi:hypothetical protein
MSLNVMIGNDLLDVKRINTAIDRLRESIKTEEGKMISHKDLLTEDVIYWLEGILNILTNKDFGQEMYDPSELVGELTP